jgi:predicted PurR-regulated permease PerM
MFSTISIVLGAIAAIAAASITVIFTAWYQYVQQVEKLRSDWIDEFRNEVASLASSIRTIIILWEATTTTQTDSSEKKLNDQEFEKFRSTNKELYEKAYKYCAAVNMRSHFISTETYYLPETTSKSLNEALGEELSNDITKLLKNLKGNTLTCGNKSRKLLKSIINNANKIIENQIKIIESRQKEHEGTKKLTINRLQGVIIVIFVFSLALPFINPEPSIAQILENQNNFIKALTDNQNNSIKTLTENQINLKQTNQLLEDLRNQIKNNNTNINNNITNLKKRGTLFETVIS